MKNTIAILLTLILFTSCRRDQFYKSCPDTPKDVPNGLIIYSGEVAADGCGWLVKVGTNWYHPESLSEEFKKTDLEVFVCFEFTGEKFYCGLSGEGVPVIKIKDIKAL